MSYRKTSQWNDINELRCLLIFKKLQRENFRRGRQMELCREMAAQTNLGSCSVSAKVCNYKSVSGVNNKSNASSNTIDIYHRYGHLSIKEINEILGISIAQYQTH